MAITRSSGHWRRATELRLPSDAFTNPNGSINGLACFGPGSCTGAGGYNPITTVGNLQAMVSTESAGVWRRGFALKLPPDSLPQVNANLLAVSCVRRGSCVAVGFYEDTASRGDLMAVTESGGKWRQAVKVAVPANADTSAGTGGELTGVACVTPLSCFAVGQYTTQSGKFEAVAATMSKGRWRRATEIGLPAGAAANPHAGLTSVACPKAGSSEAVGTYRDAAGIPQEMAVTRSSGRWRRAIKMPLPASSHGAEFESVACTGSDRALRSASSSPTPRSYQDNMGDFSEGMAAVIPAP